MNVLIAGGGVAGLEALLALHAIAADRVRLTLIAPDPEFSYRPLAVAEPFALGRAHRVPLSQFTDDTGAELVIDAVVRVDDEAGEVTLAKGDTRAFDALVLAPGVAPSPASKARRRGGPAETPMSTAACCATSRRVTASGWRSSYRPVPSGRSPLTSSR